MWFKCDQCLCSNAINAYYHILNIQGDKYLTWGSEHFDLDNVLRRLGKPGTQWTLKLYSIDKVCFQHTTLSCYAKAWYSFICANLMPIRHQKEVIKDRDIVLFDIVTGL